MTILKVGIASFDDFRARSLAIARGEYKTRADEPKIWFHSIESFAKVLSEPNRELLALIARTQPASLDELAQRTQRAPSNLSRTLKRMAELGLVRFEKGEGRKRVPRVDFDGIQLDMPLAS